MASRNPSPTKLKEITVTAMNIPGSMISHGWERNPCQPSCASVPQEASGADIPSPKKDKKASPRIIPGTSKNMAMTMIPNVLGSRCLVTSLLRDAPNGRADKKIPTEHVCPEPMLHVRKLVGNGPIQIRVTVRTDPGTDH